jgi:hypothetical protein
MVAEELAELVQELGETPTFRGLHVRDEVLDQDREASSTPADRPMAVAGCGDEHASAVGGVVVALGQPGGGERIDGARGRRVGGAERLCECTEA